MNISEVLKKDLIRIFRGSNPLDHIQNVRINQTLRDTHCIVELKVPEVPYFVANPDVYGNFPDPLPEALRRMTDQAIAAAVMGEFRYRDKQKQPEKKPVKSQEKKSNPVDALKPERIIYSGPKTIVFWPDGTKTIVSLMEGQEYDEYGAFCAAVVKKMFGATHKAKKFIETVAVRQESNPRKPKQDAEEVREVPAKPWETTQTMPMPGTEDPNWGHKHWAPETLEEENCDG